MSESSEMVETVANGASDAASPAGPLTGKAYWRSLDELAETPEFKHFLEKEFPGGKELFENSSRRHFLKLMGASLGMAGLASCRWPKENILPFARRPAGRTPGIPEHYATGYDLGGVGTGLLVESFDGRPLKVDGNPAHPQSRGKSTSIEQALLYEMYDPDRSQAVTDHGKPSSWAAFDDFAKKHFAAVRSTAGRGVYVLSELSSSESLARLRKQLPVVCPQAVWLDYEPINEDNARAGTRLAFGAPHRALLELQNAKVILSLDDDFLFGHPAALKHARDFSARRDPKSDMNRLYAVESTYSLTGGMADHRHAVGSTEIPVVVAKLIAALRGRGTNFAQMTPDTAQAIDALAAKQLNAPWIDGLAKDLVAHAGDCVVSAGARQAPVVHALVAMINVALGNVGSAVDYVALPAPERRSCREAITVLADAIEKGQVETLLILGGNPAFDAPADLDLAGLLAKVKTGIHLSLYENETSALCRWQVPRAHAFETWGDVRDYSGVHTVVQPLIAPMFGGRTPAELVATLCGEAKADAYSLVQTTFKAAYGASGFDGRWRKALHDGFVDGSGWKRSKPPVKTNGLAARVKAISDVFKPTSVGGHYEVVFTADPKHYDGRFANNGWLQELPEPVTKLTWDNAALISPEAAEALGVSRYGMMLELTCDGRTVELPAFIVPGMAPATVAVWLGQGRRAGGRIADECGHDAYPLRTTKCFSVAAGLGVRCTGTLFPLATTQDHHAMESDIGKAQTDLREGLLIREADLAYYREHPDFPKHMGAHIPDVALWDEVVDYSKSPNRWGLAIDLNRCTGCSACVTACQSENNVPVVGKDEVARGREMHWLRIDRYYTHDSKAPGMAHQPIPCMQCENAPCEQVCPVAATVHTHEGLNDMVYNRCIGTRYCSNNCPYKVRRFNYFLNHKDQAELEQMRHNPDVTVRSRGVMEKCNYCVQRISGARIKAKNDKRPIADGEIQTACQQVCPSDAVVFGDLNDKNSRVSKMQADSLCYGLLDDLRTKPRTKYLGKVKNLAYGKIGAGTGEHVQPGAGKKHGDEKHGPEKAGH